jgi:hypothetical protein
MTHSERPAEFANFTPRLLGWVGAARTGDKPALAGSHQYSRQLSVDCLPGGASRTVWGLPTPPTRQTGRSPVLRTEPPFQEVAADR